MIKKPAMCLLTLIIISSPFAYCQDKIDDAMQKKINDAVDKGAKWLVSNWVKKERKLTYQSLSESVDDLIMLTLAHAGYGKDDPNIKILLGRALSRKEDRPYLIGIQTMALVQLDKVFFQKRIADNGQFLINNQCRNGQWNESPNPVKFDKPPITYEMLTSAKGKKDDKPKPIKLAKAKGGPQTGDNSCTTISIMGLKACMDADVLIPKDVWTLAKRGIEECQNKDGGWGYGSKEMEQQEKMMGSMGGLGGGGASAEDQKAAAVTPPKTYGSMTNSALTVLKICDFYTKTDFDKKDKAAKKGLDWLNSNFQIDANPGTTSGYFYYYLYTIERAGRILGVDNFKGTDWYFEGAKYLLEKQKPEGNWEGDNSERRVKDMGGAPEDTCFAILFLKKATNILEEGRKTEVEGEKGELKEKKEAKKEPPKQEPKKDEKKDEKKAADKQEPPKQEAAKPGQEDDELKNKLKTTKLDVDFTDKPLVDVILYLKNNSGLKIIIDTSKDLSKEMVTVQMKDTPISKILGFILSDKDLDYKVESGEVKIIDRK